MGGLREEVDDDTYVSFRESHSPANFVSLLSFSLESFINVHKFLSAEQF